MSNERRQIRKVVEEILAENKIETFEICDKITDAVLAVIEKTRPRIKTVDSVEWMIAAGVPSEDIAPILEAEKLAKEVEDAFEHALHFNPLPWDSAPKWMRLKKFIITEYQKNKNVFKNFDTERKNGGQYSKLPSNPKIYQDPDLLIAIWPQLEDNQPSKIIKADNGSGFYV